MNMRDASALARALSVQARAANMGFDWPDVEGPRTKISEELEELDEAVRHASNKPDQLNEELGDLLFSIVNYARHLDIDPDRALAATIGKFDRRFGYVEERLVEQGLEPGNVGLEQLDALWDEAKRRERNRVKTG